MINRKQARIIGGIIILLVIIYCLFVWGPNLAHSETQASQNRNSEIYKQDGSDLVKMKKAGILTK